MESEKECSQHDEALTDLWSAKNTAVCRTPKLPGTSGRHTCLHLYCIDRAIDPEWIFRKTRPAEVIAQVTKAKRRNFVSDTTTDWKPVQWQCRVRR